MARKTEIVSIAFSDESERRFRITQIRVKDAHAVMERLAKILAPIAGNAAAHMGASELEAVMGDLSGKGLADAAEAFARSINAGDIDWFSEKLRTGIAVETETEDVFVPLKGDLLDDIFAGEYAAEFQLLWAAMRINFGSFSKAGGDMRGLVRRFVTPSRSGSPKAPTPGSGASSSTNESPTG